MSVLSSALSGNFFSIAASGVARAFQNPLGGCTGASPRSLTHTRSFSACAAFEWCDKENAFRSADDTHKHRHRDRAAAVTSMG